MTAAAPCITLSFDNGPEPDVTPAILDVLRRRNLRATFFVLGHKLAEAAGQAIARRAHAEGHWIGNHTWSHARPLGDCVAEPGHAEAEIGRTQALIGSLSHPVKLFRPFGDGGRLGPHVLSGEAAEYLVAGGYTCVLWNAVPRDWEDENAWPARALTQCTAVPHALLVLHDIPGASLRHLDRFLGLAADRGARFVQDMPDACVLIRDGAATRALAPLVTPSPTRERAGCTTH